jgi:hypothetical protein
MIIIVTGLFPNYPFLNKKNSLSFIQNLSFHYIDRLEQMVLVHSSLFSLFFLYSSSKSIPFNFNVQILSRIFSTLSYTNIKCY